VALTGEQYRQLREALSDGFRERSRLRRMLRERLNRELNKITGDRGLDEVVFDLVDRADAENWAEELANAAFLDNPGNPSLVEFHSHNALALGAPPRGVLESLLRPTNPMYDVDLWVRSLMEFGARVCRVEVPRVGVWGTGFLVGPDLVLTNYHVLEPVLSPRSGAAATVSVRDVTLRFDFRRLPDGSPSPGTACRLANSGPNEWLVVASPPAAGELPGGVAAGLPNDDELDVVVVRLAEPPRGASRGWVELPPNPPGLAPGDPLVILQHPESEPLQLAIETNAVVGVNGNSTRVTYQANTLPGSSGSPCFGSSWQLAAVHHRGDVRIPPEVNEGIPAGAVRSLLDRARVLPTAGATTR
jgi:hypothetical protein